MKYNLLGSTGLKVSEIGLGGEWLERHNQAEVTQVIRACEQEGINIMDIWMSNPEVREKIGNALEGTRKNWFIQGHLGSTWQNGQYVRTRELSKVKPAFQELLQKLRTDYIDLGMIHFVDDEKEFDTLMEGEFLRYALTLKESGVIHHLGLSTHNPKVGLKAAQSGVIEMILFSVNPAFDLMPPTDNLDEYFADKYDDKLCGIDPVREELYRTCAQKGVGITVMKGYAGGRLFSAKASPFGVALTPVQCLHYALTRPAVASVMVGCDTPEHVLGAVAYENASEEEKDYASVLAHAPKHAYAKGQCTYCGHCAPCPAGIDIAMVNKLYDLATMQEKTPDTLKAHYLALSVNASDCIGCGTCETRCPFGVKVAQRMEKANELFR